MNYSKLCIDCVHCDVFEWEGMTDYQRSFYATCANPLTIAEHRSVVTGIASQVKRTCLDARRHDPCNGDGRLWEKKPDPEPAQSITSD
jgi:hypothetical protein